MASTPPTSRSKLPSPTSDGKEASPTSGSTTKRPRAARPKTIHVSASELVSAWAPIAQARSKLCSWDGAFYSKPSRNLGPDHSGIENHHRPLKALLALAPSGFPSLVSVRSALLRLNEEFGVLGVGKAADPFGAADAAANVWRIMCSDLYSMKKDAVKCGSAIIQELLAMIHLPSASSECVESGGADGADGTGAPQPLADSFQVALADIEELEAELRDRTSYAANCANCTCSGDDDDVVIVCISCNCPSCADTKANRDLRMKDFATTPTPTNTIPVPSAKRGQQHRDTDTCMGRPAAARRAASKRLATLAKAADVPVEMPISVVRRHKHPEECYLLHGANKTYLGGVRKRARADFVQRAGEAADKCRRGELATKLQVKMFLSP